MNLGRSIRGVLSYHPEVGVPGIGVFKKTHFPASYYAKERVFLPPYKQIDLVSEGENPISLVEYLQIHYEWGKEEARKRLDDTLDQLFSRLNAGKAVYLDGLGSLENDRGVLKFSPQEAGKFGYSAVAEWTDSESDSVLAGDLEAEVEKPASKGWMWVVGLFVLAAVFVGIWVINPTLFQPSDPAPNTSSSQPQAPQEGEAVAQLPDSALVVDDVGDVDDAPASVVAEAETLRGAALDPAAGLPPTTFEIIIGTFNTIDEAAAYTERLKAQGHGQVRILALARGSRLHKVSWGAYATQADAQSVLREVQQSVERGAWIDRVNR